MVLLAAAVVVGLTIVAVPLAIDVVSRADGRPVAVSTMPPDVAGAATGRPVAGAGAPPVTGQACLTGRWKEISHEEGVLPGQPMIGFDGGGAQLSFDAGGTGRADFGSGTTYSTTSEVGPVQVTITGALQFGYTGTGDTITYRDQRASGTWTLIFAGKQVRKSLTALTNAPDRYRCEGDSLTLYGTQPDHRAVFTRTGATA